MNKQNSKGRQNCAQRRGGQVEGKVVPQLQQIRVCCCAVPVYCFISRRMSYVGRKGPDKHRKANYRDNG